MDTEEEGHRKGEFTTGGCRTGEMLDRTDAGKEGCRTGGMFSCMIVINTLFLTISNCVVCSMVDVQNFVIESASRHKYVYHIQK